MKRTLGDLEAEMRAVARGEQTVNFTDADKAEMKAIEEKLQQLSAENQTEAPVRMLTEEERALTRRLTGLMHKQARAVVGRRYSGRI